MLGKVGAAEVLRHRFGYARPRYEGAREHLRSPCLDEHVGDGCWRPSTGRRIRGGEADERRQTGVGEGLKASEPRVDGRRPWFKKGSGSIVQGRHRHADFDLLELGEQIKVAGHQRRSRENGDRPVGPKEDFEGVARDPILPFDELVRIRGGGDRDEASGKLPYLLRDNRGRVSLHDDGRTPLVPVHPHQARRITKDTAMVTAYVRIERVIDSWEGILAQGGVDRHFTNLEALARRGDRNA